MRDDEYTFGSKSSNFNELVKKYKAISEDGEETSAPVEEIAEPEQAADDGFEESLNEAFESLNQYDAAAEQEVEDKEAEAAEEVYYEPNSDEDDEEDDEDEENEEENGFVFDMVEDIEEPVFDFSFDGLLKDSEPEPEIDMTFKKAEPDFSYDLNMFGAAPTSGFDISSFDDSWLDDSLDESIFYDPQELVEAAAETAQEPMPSYEPEPEEEPETVENDVYESNFIPAVEPVKPDLNAFAGGYVAASNVDGFTFDADSGLDFGDEEEDIASLPQDFEGLPVFDPVTPDKKSGKLKAKKETKAMTGFSKNYKVGGDEGKSVKNGNWFTRNFVPTADDPASEKVRKIVMIIAVLAVIGSAGYLLNDYLVMPYLNQKNINELQEMISDSSNVINEQTVEEKYPGVDFPEGMLEKYADLYARNQDFVGWINIDGLGISLPIVRGENNSKYLKTDFDGNKNKYGSIFMNCTNSVDNLNYNTTLFGHYMKDEKMFGKLMDYKDAKGYKTAPVIEFNTIYGDYKWKIFAVMITNGTSDGDDGYLFNYMFTDLSSNESVEEFLGEVKLRSLYYPEVDIAVSDKILTLSTCTYELDEGRLIIMARMVRPGESTDVNVESIRFNPNPRYPQGYYDKNGLSNPYKSYPRWYPS